MSDWDCKKNSIYVTRDAGYNKIQSISSKSIKNNKKLDNHEIISRIDLLKELYSKLGVCVHPERMTNWYAYTD